MRISPITLVMLAAIAMSPRAATAQSGTICLYADPNATQCDLVDDAPGALTVHVIHTGSPGALAVEFMAPKPACMTGATWIGDTRSFPLVIGDSQTGVSVAYGTCQASPVHVMSITYAVSGTTQPDCGYPVLPAPGRQHVEVSDCANELGYGAGGTTYVNSSLECACADVTSAPVIVAGPDDVVFTIDRDTDTLTVRNLGDQDLEWSTTWSGGPWLTFAPESGTNDATVALSVDRAGLAPDVYDGVLRFDSNGGSANVDVQMVVQPEGPFLEINPPLLDFGDNKVMLGLSIMNRGAEDLEWTVNETIPWAEVSDTSGTNNAVVDVTVDRTGLAFGSYTGEIVVNSNGGDAVIPVYLDHPAPPSLGVAPDSLDFGGAATLLPLNVTNEGDGILHWSIATNDPWLSVSPTSGTGDAQVDVAVGRIGRPVGPYVGGLQVTSNGGSLDVPVRMDVVGVLDVWPESLNFFGSRLSANVYVDNAGQGVLAWTVATSEPWLSATPESGTNGGTLTVEVDGTGLQNGTHNAELTVASAAGDVVVPVEFVVGPYLSVSPGDLDFGFGETELQLSIMNAGFGTLDWDVAADQPWITVAPESGTNDGPVAVTVDRAGLADGSYQGNIEVTSNGGSATIPVSMEVGPLLGVTPTRLTFYNDVLVKSLFIRNDGNRPLDWTATPSADWLSVEPTSGTDDSTVIVTADRADLGPGTYQSSITVASNGGDRDVSATLTIGGGAVGFLTVYYDNALHDMYEYCEGPGVQDIYIAALGFPDYITAVEFSVNYPDALMWLADSEVNSTLWLGDTANGIAMTWDAPQLFEVPQTIVHAVAFWNCNSCEDVGNETGDLLVRVMPHPQSGELRAVAWPSEEYIPVTGGLAFICFGEPVDVRPMTWSQIKALMRGEQQLKADKKPGE